MLHGVRAQRHTHTCMCVIPFPWSEFLDFPSVSYCWCVPKEGLIFSLIQLVMISMVSWLEILRIWIWVSSGCSSLAFYYYPFLRICDQNVYSVNCNAHLRNTLDSLNSTQTVAQFAVFFVHIMDPQILKVNTACFGKVGIRNFEWYIVRTVQLLFCLLLTMTTKQ